MARPGNRPEEHTPHDRLKLALALSALFASATGCFAETAQREVFLSATADDLAKIIQDIGYRAEIAKNNAGKRFVRTRIGGKDVAILLFSVPTARSARAARSAPISRRRRRTTRRRACASPTSS